MGTSLARSSGAIDTTEGATPSVTVIVVASLMPSADPVMVTTPGETAVTGPFETVAMPSSDDVHTSGRLMTWLVSSRA